MSDVDPKSVRFDKIAESWLSANNVDKFLGKVVIPQKVIEVRSSFSGEKFYAFELYVEGDEDKVLMKISRTVAKKFIEQGIRDASQALGMKFIVDCERVRDMCLPYLKPADDINKNKKKKEKDGGDRTG